MSSNKKSRFSLQPSNAFLMTFLVIVLVINVALFLIAYFLINPYINASVNPDLYSKIFWAGFVAINFTSFAITYAIINSKRYWIDFNFLEIQNVYRPKKRKEIPWKEISYLKVRRFPIISNAFDFGTILLMKETEKGKDKVIARLLGIKHDDEFYFELNKYLKDSQAEED